MDLDPGTGNEETDHFGGVRGSSARQNIQGIQKDNR